jgi:hypothetical protein
MLLEFSAENFRSLRDGKTLDLRASATKDLAEVVRHPVRHGRRHLSGVLPVIAAVFGANASGQIVALHGRGFHAYAAVLFSRRTPRSRVTASLEHVTTFRFDPARRDEPRHPPRPLPARRRARHEYGFVLQPRGTSPRPSSRASPPNGCVPGRTSRVRDLFLRGDAAPRCWPRPPPGGSPSAASTVAAASPPTCSNRPATTSCSSASPVSATTPRAKAVVGWFNDLFATTSARGPNDRAPGSRQSFLLHLCRSSSLRRRYRVRAHRGHP